MASPASAVAPLDTDDVLIKGQQVDFGNNPHKSGSPQTPAKLEWSYSGATVKALLTGTVYWDATNKSGCARVRMTMYNSSNAVLGAPTYSGRACRAGLGGLVSKYVELPLGSTAGAYKVVITTQTAPSASTPGSAYQNTGSVTRFFGID